MNVFNYTTMMAFDSSNDRAKKFLKSFLEETSEIYDMKQSMRSFHKKVEYIQN